ncbi:TonB-dependent receptor [uncultured Thiodictyon sp.]|uniref:TonB-dependent receptor n=1 Tax=uncultured Thiodictyon sp. TaxID=1846217 RepID=UPI0025F002B6|nr:TonB-dependent receptor [uncultured Thiodictyon sp.]
MPALLALAPGASGEEAPQLGTVEVSADAPTGANVSLPSDTATVYEVGPAGVQLWGGAGATNPYRTASGMPGVNAQTPDAYGLTNIPGGVKGMRVRGELSTHGGTGTIEGLSLTGIGPGPGYQWLFDAENFAAVSLAQGPIAPDRLAFYTTSGALDTRLLWPQEQLGFQINQTVGSFALNRTFARVDSGRLPDGTAFFVSGSVTDADKWRGPGATPAGRQHLEAALSRPLGERGNVKIYAAYTDMQMDNYRALTYAQTRDLGTYRFYDFADTATTNPLQAATYYQYNRQSFKDWAIFSELSWKFGEATEVVFKPFYVNEEGYYLDGTSTGKVRQWLMDHDWYGATLELTTRLVGTDLKVGYWWESMDPPGPPTAWKMYTPNASGSLAGPVAWTILADVAQRRRYESFYAIADRQIGALQVQGGLRTVSDTQPGLHFYDTTGLGDVSYDQALAQSKGVIAGRSVAPITMNEVLPFLSMAYELSPRVLLRTALGRNYGAPSFDLWPVYQSYYAVFKARGITANQLWQAMRPETADAVDVGMRLTFERGWLEPTLYYARYYNKSVAYDPDGAGPLVPFSQNVGQSRGWGVQLTGYWRPLAGLDLFGSLSYDNNQFVEDLPLFTGGTLAVSGLQLPDVPLWSAKVGATWSRGAFAVSPVVRYTDSRYGDTQHTQQVPGYTTVDLTLRYQHRIPRGMLTASVTCTNLFDAQYIGFINASYYQTFDTSSAYYYPGAPRAVVAQVSLAF